MHLFNEYNKIKKYNSYGAILKNFAHVRLELYQKRKDFLLGKWRKEMDILKWKMKFIEDVIAEKIIIFKKNKANKKANVLAKLEELNFPKFMIGAETKMSYNYLMMHWDKFTEEEIEKLRKELEDKNEQIETLENKTTGEIWEEELEEFMKAYDVWEANSDLEYNNLMAGNKKPKKKKGKKISDKEAIDV